MPSPPGADPPAKPPPACIGAALVQCTTDLLVLVDAAGLLRWCNRPVEALLGQPLSALAGTPWHDALPAPADHRLALAGFAARLKVTPAAPIAPIDVELHPAGAPPLWLKIGAHAVPADAPGPDAPAQWLLAMRDITDAVERSRFEREATRLSELLEMAQEFGRLGVWERDIPSGTGRWDRHVFNFYGLDPARGTPSHEEALSHLHPEDRPRLRYLESTRRAGRYTQRYRIRRPDGQTRWIQSQWEVQNAPAGAPYRAIGILMDDTEVLENARALGDPGALLKMALQLGHIAIWRHDLRTDRVHYNDDAHQVLAVPPGPDGLSLQEMRARVHPDEVAHVAASAERALANPDLPTDIEARFSDGQGHWRTMLTRRVMERGPDGTPRAWIGIALDVSAQADERRRTAESMHRLRTATAAAGIGIWSHDTVTDQAHWDEQMFKLIGREPALGAPSLAEWETQVVHPADRDRMRRAREAREASADGAAELRYRVAWPNGEVRWLENRVRREALRGHRTVFGVTLDITDRMRAEHALRNADERAALAARGAGIGTWELDLTGTEEHWDAQMFHLRGLAPGDRAPPRAERLALLHPDDVPAVVDSNLGSAADPQPLQYEFRVRWPDGGYRWLASRSILVADEAGRPLRRIGVNWDITEARAAEAARQQSVLAQRENLAKSQFLTRVSHELRTPLNAVLGFAQLMQAEPGVSASQRMRLGWIRSAGDHLLLLIEDMLDLSGLEIGQLKLKLQAVPLDELLHETLPLVEPLAAQHGVTLQLGSTGGAALADRTRLRQVLINLLSNGIKYNRPQGSVKVSAESVGGRVVLRVDDSGRGLDDAQLAHLFEPFNRLGAERDGIQGSGIGLVIVKALVERMGGTVQASSRPGEGTRFRVGLPAAEGPPPNKDVPAHLPPPPAPAASPTGRLLYIEDNPVNMLLVQELVASRPNLALIAATTGEQGVQLAITHRPALVLVDMHLPDFDGFEVLRRLRADPRTAVLRCIALSANALPEDIARALAAGFAEYWTKPIHFGGFLNALDTLFSPKAGA